MKQPRLPLRVDPYRLVEQQRTLQGKLSVNDLPRLNEFLYIQADGQTAVQAKTVDTAKVIPDQQTAKKSAVNDQPVLNGQNEVDVILSFSRSQSELPTITGSIRGVIRLQCQRCLEAVDFMLAIDVAVVLVSSDLQAEKLQEGYDTWLVEDDQLFISDFIEDEILLALPIVVMHQQCEPDYDLSEQLMADKAGQEEITKSDTAENPFAVLKDLKLDN